jgi:mono/diheme cytochrome c family protein
VRALATLVLLSLCACDEWEPMQLQDRPDVYRPSPVFEDGRAMRPVVPDTVEQDSYRENVGLVSGAQFPDGGWSNEMPMTLTRELADQGRARFEVFCAPCHGLLANGEAVVARKMLLRPPPDLLVAKERGRTLASGELPRPLGFYFSVMTHGYGLMPSYADTLNPTERWAVVAYLRALALSQRAPLALAPHDVQDRLALEQP